MMELNTHPIFKQSKIIRLLGYSNGNTDYDKAKIATEKGWPPLSEAQIQDSLNKGHWIGGVIAEGYILIDVDNKEKGNAIHEGLLRTGYSFIAIETPNGYQFMFRDTGKIKNQGAKKLTLCGIVVDFRLSHKGYIVLPTKNTEGRKVIQLPEKEPDPMPLCFLPVRGKKESDNELDRIFDGSRTTTLISHASKIREWNIAHNLNLSIEEKRQVLFETNQILCYPPLEGQKLDTIFQSAENYPVISTPRNPSPFIDVKILSEKIAEATTENYSELLPELANLDSEIEKEILCKALSKRIGANYRTVRNEIKTYEQKKESVITDNNIIIAHPSYEINNDFISIGLRETVVENNEPQDRNFYLIAIYDGYILHDNKVFQINDKHIIFDVRDRFLLRAEDRWTKENILSFIKSPVSPEGLYQEIKQALKQHIEFQKESIYGLVAAWIMATYFFLIFHAFPFLFIYGKKQSGKSRLLDLLERLAFNAMKIKGMSVASMTDSIDGVRGTFLNDQAESLSDSRNAEILGILADSYTVGGGKRRIVDISNKRRRVVEFGTYAPKAFASIREIDSDLKDRCIQITMLRTMKDYPYPEAFLPIWHGLRDKLYRLLLTKWREVREIYQNTGEGVTQRVRELWRPIETILILENIPDEEKKVIKGFFLESMLETQSELTDSEIEVFEILLRLLEGQQEAILTGEDVTGELKQKPKEDMSDRGLQIWIGRVFNQFSLYNSHAGRMNKKRAYHFTYNHVKDIYNRYTNTSNGFNGNMVKPLDNQQSAIDHLENRLWSNGNTNGLDDHFTREQPETKSEMVNCEGLINNDSDHNTIKTRTINGNKPFLKTLEIENEV